MLLQHFIIEGKHYGTAPRGLITIDRSVHGRPLSKLFYCSQCGEVFGKCPILDTVTNKTTSWQAVYATCRRCTPEAGQIIPGSIWHFEKPFTDAFPDAVLRWELERHLDQAEKDMQDDN